MPSPRGSSWPRDRTCISLVPDSFFTIWATREGKNAYNNNSTRETSASPGAVLSTFNFILTTAVRFYIFQMKKLRPERVSNLLKFKHLMNGARQNLNLSWLSLKAKPVTKKNQSRLFNPVHFVNGFTSSVQFNSVSQSCPTACDPMDCSTPGFPVHQQLPELAQTPVHEVSDVWPAQVVFKPLFLSLRLCSHHWCTPILPTVSKKACECVASQNLGSVLQQKEAQENKRVSAEPVLRSV